MRRRVSTSSSNRRKHLLVYYHCSPLEAERLKGASYEREIKWTKSAYQIQRLPPVAFHPASTDDRGPAVHLAHPDAPRTDPTALPAFTNLGLDVGGLSARTHDRGLSWATRRDRMGERHL